MRPLALVLVGPRAEHDAADDALSDPKQITSSFGSPAEIGRLFLTDHLLAFEITSIVLLIAAVGGVVLGTRSLAEDEEDAARKAASSARA